MEDSDPDELSDVPEERGNKGKLKSGGNTTRRRGQSRTAAVRRGNVLVVKDKKCLYEIVRNGRRPMRRVVDDWIEAYQKDRDVAMLNLMQFFIHCSGCPGKVTPRMRATKTNEKIISDFIYEFVSKDYPMIMRSGQWRNFRGNLSEFVRVLVRQCQYNIIYDECLMIRIMKLFKAMANTKCQAFRHTATLTTVKLMTALVDVVVNLRASLANTKRQLQAERLKHRDKRSLERLEQLTAQRDELDENIEIIHYMYNYLFKNIFEERSRDVIADIRAICVGELGVWMVTCPEPFLEKEFLCPYMSSNLWDKDPNVCIKCLQALQSLYAEKTLIEKLQWFTKKYKDRIVRAMTWDRNFRVALEAVKVAILIQKYHGSILNESDCERVYMVVFSPDRALAQAAGEFCNMRIFTPEETKMKKAKRSKRSSFNTPLILNLVDFFIDSEFPELVESLVDSFFESNQMMKDWKCMSDLLLDEPAPNETLTDRQETSLIEIMMCCVKQAATGEPPYGRKSPRKKQLSAKEAKQVEVDKVKLTEHLIGPLPLMLNKYLADSEKVANLMTIPQHFKLEIYVTRRQDKSLDLLLKAINEIVDRHADTNVLKACSKTYEALCDENFPLHRCCTITLNTLIEKLVHKYETAWLEYKNALSATEMNEDVVFALTVSLKKVWAFYTCHDLGPWNVWDNIYDCLKHSIGADENVHDDVPSHALACCHRCISCDFAKLDMKSPNPREVEQLQDKVSSFIPVCRTMLTSEVDVLEQEGYTCICEILLMLSIHSLGDNLLMQSLAFDNADSYLPGLMNFVQQKVFVNADKEGQDANNMFEELEKRREFLRLFLLLVNYSVFRISVVSDIYRHYVKFYDSYGDLMRYMWSRFRVNNMEYCAKTMALTLTNMFEELPREAAHSVINRQSEAFLDIKELAKRFATMFGKDHMKARKAVTALLEKGIAFCVKPWIDPNNPDGIPPNIAFFEILKEFSKLLTAPEKQAVLTYYKMMLPPLPRNSFDGDDWEPLRGYHTSLRPYTSHSQLFLK